MEENIDYIVCPICFKKMKQIHYRHLKKEHNLAIDEFLLQFPSQTISCKNTKNKRSESHSEQVPSNKGKKYEEYLGKKRAKELKIYLSNLYKDKFYVELHGEEKAKEIKGKQSKARKNILYEQLYGEDETRIQKQKRRIKIIQRMQKNNGFFPGYNPKSIPIFQEFKKINNLTNCYFATEPHEWIIKELGYFLDFIDFDLKLIIEIDESRHFDKSTNELLKKDLQRQNEIQEFYPDFQFLRFKESEMNKVLEVNCAIPR